MRVLERSDTGEFSLTEDLVHNDIPRYAILSHTWGPDSEEVTYKDLINGTGKSKAGYDKIRFCAEQARRDGLQFFWVDTCCIDKANNTELSEAINSMSRWYQNAARCYVHLADVSASDQCSDLTWEPAFRASRWFTRGWTLQELLAPALVEFFSREGRRLGDKKSLEWQIHEITGIAIPALQGTSLSHFSIDERLSWARTRQTKREEDHAYSLLGIFGVWMPLIYGEGKDHALKRLLKEISQQQRSSTCLPNAGERQQTDVDSRLVALETSQGITSAQYERMCMMLTALQNSALSTIRLQGPYTIRDEYVLDIKMFKSASAARWSAEIRALYDLGFLPRGHSQLPQALLKEPITDERAVLVRSGDDSQGVMNLSTNNGPRFIIFLHGERDQDNSPTAETIAIFTRRSLHRIQSRDLAHQEVEDILKMPKIKIFSSFRGRVIAVDAEADMLLTRRTHPQFSRNKKDPVMIHLLESFRGIFATAHVEPFKPHAHITLKVSFSGMDETSAMKVWEHELQRLRIEGLALNEGNAMAFAKRSFTRNPGRSAREIRDIVQSAKELATHEHVESLRTGKRRIPWSQPDPPVVTVNHLKRAAKACEYLREDDDVEGLGIDYFEDGVRKIYGAT